MEELNSIRQVLARTARRRRLAHGLSGLWKGALWGAVLLLVTLVTYKVAPIPAEVLYGIGGVSILLAVVGFVWGWSRPVTLMDTARFVDSQKRFQERLSTALEVAESKLDESWKNLVVSDAAARLKDVDAKQLLPIALTRASRWAFICLLMAACLGFVPEYRTKAYKQAQSDAKSIKTTGTNLVELTRRTLEQKPPAMEPAKKALEEVNQLGEHFEKAKLSRGEAMKELASAMQKLKDETKEMRQSQAFKNLEKAAKTTSTKGGTAGSPELQKKMDELQQQMAGKNANPDALDKLKKDLDKAQEMAKDLDKMSDAKKREEAEKKLQQQLADLSKESKEMGLDLQSLDKAIAELAESKPDEVVKDLEVAEVDLEKMRDQAKALEKMKMQMDKLGKDLAEQLKNGQVEAAQSTIAKMQQELEKSDLSKEQMDKLMDQVSKAQKPGQEYGKAGDFLKDAAKQMAKGDKNGAKDSLGEASKELGKMMAEMSDAQSILESMEALQQAQMAIGNGQSWANMPMKGRGKGGKGQGKENETSGGGFGTWHDEDSWQYPEFKDKWDNSGQQAQNLDPKGVSNRGDGSLADNLVATKVKGQMTPGGPMPSITMKGVSIKGNSKVQIQEMVGAAQSDAQGALSQDQVPRAYQGAVKDYFNDLK
jgi:hypothetical protein